MFSYNKVKQKGDCDHRAPQTSRLKQQPQQKTTCGTSPITIKQEVEAEVDPD